MLRIAENEMRLWAEYESSGAQLESLVVTMTVEKLSQEMLYPWNERGSVWDLIRVMMQHEVEHREIIR